VKDRFFLISRVWAGDRATEFKQRCQQLQIKGVTLHSYRYAWAERAKTAGYPERFAQEALGLNSKGVHRAYANPRNIYTVESPVNASEGCLRRLLWDRLLGKSRLPVNS